MAKAKLYGGRAVAVLFGMALAVVIAHQTIGWPGNAAAEALTPKREHVELCVAQGVTTDHDMALCSIDEMMASAQRHAFERNYAEHVNVACTEAGDRHGDRAFVDCQQGRPYVAIRPRQGEPESCDTEAPGIAL